MSKNLVIVESPAKCKTIQKYLGKDYEVMASYGHISDLVKKNMGIDIENDFKPTYEISADKKKNVSALRKAAKAADKVWIATDEDREGEAIGWHVANALKLDIDKTARITFHEITKPALEAAIQNPRFLDTNLINAQQARRILDRLVWFELSPVLWKKIKGWLSAGRVQSVAVRLIVDREREIQKFIAKRPFKIDAELLKDKANFKASTAQKIKEQEKAHDFLKAIETSELTVEKVEDKPLKKRPSAPFTTSTLQQEASRKIGSSVAQTMRVAQKLYEAGHITYMRTDSVNLSKTAQNQATKLITEKWGAEYSNPTFYKGKSANAQEAHECIRPTDFFKMSAGADAQQKRLYELIRKRTLASQMSPATGTKTKASILVSNHKTKLIAEWETITFPWFITLYQESSDDEQDTTITKNLLPALSKWDVIHYKNITATETVDRHPPRYTEASLVKQLEKEWIGRPSTYAPTINTVQRRWYVVLEDRPGTPTDLTVISLSSKGLKEETISKNVWAEKRKLFPTDIGLVVTDFLVQNFPKIVDYSFTANVEEEFDNIAHGKIEWTAMLHKFYKPFHSQVTTIDETAERASGERAIGTDPVSGKPIIARIGRYWPLVQIGDSEDEDKKFASIRGGKSIETITLEEALECFKLPRHLGDHEGKKVTASLGRFGPYVKRDSTFASLKKTEEFPDDDPYEVTFERALVLIKEKQKKDKEKMINQREHEWKKYSIQKWRRWAFLKVGRKNIKLPKERKEKAAEITLEQCIKWAE